MKHPFNLKDPIHLMAVGFGSGLPKFAPGTWGTVGAIPFFYLLVQLPILYFYIAVAIAAVAGIYICGKCAKDSGVHDHGSIVWDEFVGLWIALLLLPVQGCVHWIWIGVGFLWFRLFDIWKPFPISLLDKKVHGGLGIMLDDIVAGIFALLALQLSLYCFANVYLDIEKPFWPY